MTSIKDLSSHLKNFEAVGGKLFLTNKRLIFISHKFNLQNHKLYILLKDIEEVGTYKVFWIFDKGLAIKTIVGKREKFMVKQQEEWIKLLG